MARTGITRSVATAHVSQPQASSSLAVRLVRDNGAGNAAGQAAAYEVVGVSPDDTLSLPRLGLGSLELNLRHNGL